jgi:hypothetical protein
MRSATPRLLVIIVTSFLVSAIGSGCITLHSSSGSTAQNSLATEKPCRDGLIVVEQQPEAPVRIANLKTDCRNPYIPGASFQVEPNVARPIRYYEVRIFQSYDGVYSSYSTSSAGTREAGGSVFSKDSSSSDYMSWGLERGWFKDPEPKFTFTVWSVTYVDGSTWDRAAAVAASRL